MQRIMPSTNTDSTDDLTILDALTRYLQGRAMTARKHGDGTFEISTVDVQTRILSRCRERYDVVALPSTFARKWRLLRNDEDRLDAAGVESTEVVDRSPLTVKFETYYE